MRFVFLLGAAFSAVLVAMWVRGSAVSFDERHLRAVSLLFLVGGIDVLLGLKNKTIRSFAWVVIAGASIYGLASFAGRAAYLQSQTLGERGIRHTIASKQMLDFARSIDYVAPDGARPVVIVPSPEIALEFRHARVKSNHADFDSIEDLRRDIQRGRVARLYVFVQKKLVANGKADAILSSFVDYSRDRWVEVSLGDFVCFYQVTTN